MTREQKIICKQFLNDADKSHSCNEYKLLMALLDQEPTTKNDLVVDCISREQALVTIRNLYPSMPRVDFNGSLRKWVDKYKPYIECDDAIKQLPPTTPIRPKGHWIRVTDKTGHLVWECGKCGWQQRFNTNFCPDCGSDNREVEDDKRRSNKRVENTICWRV